MSISAQDFLTAANSICDISSEAGYRSAVSRAYYSVYHGCLEWEKSFPALGSNGGTIGGVHQQLINRLRNPAHEVKDEDTRKLSRIVAARTEALKTKRTAADYFLTATGHAEVDAKNACAQAQELLQRIGQYHQVDQTAPAASPAPAQPHVSSEPDPSPSSPSPTGQRPLLKRVR